MSLTCRVVGSYAQKQASFNLKFLLVLYRWQLLKEVGL
jgi:hypothetical protein